MLEYLLWRKYSFPASFVNYVSEKWGLDWMVFTRFLPLLIQRLQEVCGNLRK